MFKALFASSAIFLLLPMSFAKAATPEPFSVGVNALGYTVTHTTIVSSGSYNERASDAATNIITEIFIGTGAAASTTGTNSTYRINLSASGPTAAKIYMGLDNFVDRTYAIPGATAGTPNVARFSQYTRADGTANWQNGAIPSQGFALDAVVNDLIPWGTSGYPAAPPVGANLQNEMDMAVWGPDPNNTRVVLAADCKQANNSNSTVQTECDAIYSGANGYKLTDGVTRAVAIHDINKTGYDYQHSAFTNLNNTGEAGSRAFWLKQGDKIAFNASGISAIGLNPITGGLLHQKSGGNLPAITVTAGGSGYTYCAASIANGSGGGGGTSLTCTVASGAVSAIGFGSGSSSSGNDFTTAPTIAITGDGTGATATVTPNTLTQTPVGDGLATIVRTLGPQASATMPAYAWGWQIQLGGTQTATQTYTLPTYNAATMQPGVITTFDNTGTTATSANWILTGGKVNLTLYPGDKAGVVIDPSGTYRVAWWAPISGTFAKLVVPVSGPVCFDTSCNVQMSETANGRLTTTIGGVAVMSVDATGTVRTLGAIRQETP